MILEQALKNIILLLSFCFIFSVDLMGQCIFTTNSTAITISGNVVKIEWDAVTDAERYRLRYRTIGGSWIEVSTAGEETFRFFNGLTPDNEYEYQIKSLCGAIGNSVWSATKTFTTLSTICDIPESSTVTYNCEATTISWLTDEGDLKYKIKYKPTSGGAWIETTLNVNTITLTDLLPNTEYKYKLKTKCSNLISPWTNWSDNFEFTTPSANLSDLSPSKAYVSLKRKLDASFIRVSTDEKIYVTYQESYQALDQEQLSYRIFNESSDTGSLPISLSGNKQYGANWIVISPGVDSGYYILEVKGGNKDETYYARLNIF